MTYKSIVKKGFFFSVLTLLTSLLASVVFANSSNKSNGPPAVSTDVGYSQTYPFAASTSGYQTTVANIMYDYAIRFPKHAPSSTPIYAIPMTGATNGVITIPYDGTYNFILSFILVNYTASGGGAAVDFGLYNAATGANFGGFSFVGGNWRARLPATTSTAAGTYSATYQLTGIRFAKGATVYVGAGTDICCGPQNATVDLESNGSLTVTRTGN